MIRPLGQKIQALVTTQLVYHVLQQRKRGYPVQVAEVVPFMEQLKRQPYSYEQFIHFITGAETFCRDFFDQRSIVIPLRQPLRINGRNIFALRLKGVLPQVYRDKDQVVPHKGGLGAPNYVFEPQAEGFRYNVRLLSEDKDFEPKGAMSFSCLAAETTAALVLGSEQTDCLLGFGLFGHLEYIGSPVGFVVYGLETKRDVRLGLHFAETQGQTLNDLAEKMGATLRQAQQKIVHRAPTATNFGLRLGRQIKILDLEKALPISSIPQSARAAFLMIDILKASKDYYELAFQGITSLKLLPNFFAGYFNQERESSFCQEIKPYVGRPHGQETLKQVFGFLPTGDQATSGVNPSPSLVDPYVFARYQEREGAINLTDYFDRMPLLALLGEAVEQVVESTF